MSDILFTTVPYTDTDEPLMSPAVLKAIAQSAGYSAVAIDLNIELVNDIKSCGCSTDLVDFLMHNNLKDCVILDFVNLVDRAVDRILSYKTKAVGLSLLTLNCQVFTKWLCMALKSRCSELQIVIGGPGIKNSLVCNTNTFCEELKQLKIIDHYITGDGETALVEFLNGNLNYPGIDSPPWQELPSMEGFPYPDYGDYDFDLYKNVNIPLCDSKGCVRNCDFCDLIEHWKKFVYRSAESVFAEMLEQIQRYNIRNFSLKNSLTNGNNREFKKLLQYIAEYNHSRDQQDQISWTGYFIVRPVSHHPEELWQLMAKTNAKLALGIESVIQHVRWGLGKKFTNSDIDFHLDMAQKHQVPLVLLLIVGYPTETREDYEFTKQWFKDRVNVYGNNNPVCGINLAPLAILDGTGLDKKSNELKLDRGENINIWINRETKISQDERAEYYKELFQICQPFNPPSGATLHSYENTVGTVA